MPAGQYHILADKGSTFKLFMEYQTAGGTAVDLSSHEARMQVRRNSNNENILLFMTGTTLTSSVTGGGITGYFSPTGGVAGTGGITLNAGFTGLTGTTGGIYVQVDDVSMSNIPSGRHFYDLELIQGSDVTRIIQGRFEVTPEVTR